MTDPTTATPRCIRCGHPPSHERWCDYTYQRLRCPQCAEVFGDVHETLKEQTLSCPACMHRWKLSELPKGKLGTELDLCCDGECEWNMPAEEVAAWLDAVDEDDEEGDESPPIIVVHQSMPGIVLRHYQTMRVDYACVEGIVTHLQVLVVDDDERAHGAAQWIEQRAKRDGEEIGEARGRDVGFTTGFLAAQGLAQGLSEEEATARAVEQAEGPSALPGLLWLRRAKRRLQERMRADDPLAAAQAALQRPAGAVEPEGAPGDAPSMPCPVCGPLGPCRPVADQPGIWACSSCGLRAHRGVPDDGEGALEDLVGELHGDPVAWGYLSERNVPLRQAYNEARVEIARLQRMPEQSPFHVKRRDWYRTDGSWGSHFGRAAEDLDELDRAIANESFMALQTRDRLRRMLACVRNHLVEGHDEIRGILRTAMQRRLSGSRR